MWTLSSADISSMPPLPLSLVSFFFFFCFLGGKDIHHNCGTHVTKEPQGQCLVHVLTTNKQTKQLVKQQTKCLQKGLVKQNKQHPRQLFSSQEPSFGLCHESQQSPCSEKLSGSRFSAQREITVSGTVLCSSDTCTAIIAACVILGITAG